MHNVRVFLHTHTHTPTCDDPYTRKRQTNETNTQKQTTSWTKGQATVPSLRAFPAFLSPPVSLSLWGTSPSQITNTKPLWNCWMDINPISHYKEMAVCGKQTSGSPHGARANIPSLSTARYKCDQARLLINSAPFQIRLQLHHRAPCIFKVGFNQYPARRDVGSWKWGQ